MREIGELQNEKEMLREKDTARLSISEDLLEIVRYSNMESYNDFMKWVSSGFVSLLFVVMVLQIQYPLGPGSYLNLSTILGLIIAVVAIIFINGIHE
ncbi:MAG: hypothetical protein ACP5NK_01685 [Thermoplasmata archaeon]